MVHVGVEGDDVAGERGTTSSVNPLRAEAEEHILSYDGRARTDQPPAVVNVCVAKSMYQGPLKGVMVVKWHLLPTTVADGERIRLLRERGWRYCDTATAPKSSAPARYAVVDKGTV